MTVIGGVLLLLVFMFGGAGVLQGKFKGSGCSGIAAGAALFLGIPTHLLVEIHLRQRAPKTYLLSEYGGALLPSESLELYIPLAALSLAAAGFAVLSAVKPRLRMWALLLASAASLPLGFALRPIPLWGFGLITLVPSFVFLFDAVIGRFAGKNPWEPE